MSNDWTIDPTLGAQEGFVDFEGLRTWYAVVGDEASERADGKAPLLLLHGGPGAGHDYLESMAALAATGRRVIFYDQQGCGNSDQPDDPVRWTVDFYVRELAAIRRALGLQRCHILGQSWGGMLLMEYLVTRPEGVVSATIASSPASMPLWIAETGRQRAALPADVVATLERHEAAGTWDDPEYQAAVGVFYDRHLCRVVPNPEFVTRSFAKLARNPQVYRTMNGPTAEEPDRYMAAVGDFLARAEAGDVRRRADAPARAQAPASADPIGLARSAGAGRLTGREGGA